MHSSRPERGQYAASADIAAPSDKSAPRQYGPARSGNSSASHLAHVSGSKSGFPTVSAVP